MDEDVDRLAHKAVRLLEATPKDQRLIICVAGPPGSGKSTLAYPLTDRINALLGHAPQHPSHGIGPPAAELAAPGEQDGGHPDAEQKTEAAPAISVPLDGWHLTRAQLDALPDPATAHYRRGAPFTFDAPGYLAFISALNPVTPSRISFHLFDHARKDPVPSPVAVNPAHRVVLVEGLYTLLDAPGWADAARLCAMRVWVDVDREVARARLVERNWAAGLASTREGVVQRVDESDMRNGEEVRENRVEPTDVVVSRDDPALMRQG